jgi:Zn-dependent peptidase ImmA (M78 family)
MAELADDLARWLFNYLKFVSNPPVDVEDLASRMGVESIRNAQMIEDGRLEQDGTTATIYLRDGLPTGRRRFTIAHELGHRLLLHPRAPAERYRRRLAGDAEERLCDDLAAAILLPRQWVGAEFHAAPHRLNTVRRLAAVTETSLSASLVRLSEVVNWPESLLRFKFVNDRWRLDAPAAVPFDIHCQIRTTAATSHSLDETGRRTRGDVRTELPLRIGQHDYTVPAELSVARTIAVALIDLRTCRPTTNAAE